MKQSFFALAFAATLTGCGTTAVIKQVADKDVAPLSTPEKAKPIQFRKVVVKLKRGEHIGAVTMGLLCVTQPGSDITWKGGRIAIDSEELTETFKDELQKQNFPTVGDPNALFEDPSAWKTEIMVAGLVTEMKLNVCYPMGGFGNLTSAKGEAYMKVEWQIYSRLDRSVVHSFKTEGSFKAKQADPNGGDSAILNAFAQATRNMLADAKFREIVAKGGQTIRSTESVIGERVNLVRGKSKPMTANRDEWPSA
ncbi:MAG: hypothetical protein FGM40_04260, partial [Rhodocyclaceae bacterium]|nr:hypothetical protein [Rhodocyclaceae bacterium]